MIKTRFSFLAGAILVLGSGAAFSWGPEGHETVADIAEARLEPLTQSAITEVMGSADISLSDIANCADTLRYGDTDCAGLFNPPLGKDTATAPWHYTNIEIKSVVSETPTTAALEEFPDCNEITQGPIAQFMGDTASDCIHAQIKFALSQLNTQSPTGSKAIAVWQRQRKIALMYLVHLVGDAHQPMHISDDHDAGGNAEKVKFEGTLERFHELWDDLIDKTQWKDQTPGAANMLANQLIKEINAMPQAAVESWIAGTAEDMVNNAVGESFNISKKTIYPNYYKAKKSEPGEKNVALDADYKTEMQPIAYLRLQKAGVRLAALLNGVNWDGRSQAQTAKNP